MPSLIHLLGTGLAFPQVVLIYFTLLLMAEHFPLRICPPLASLSVAYYNATVVGSGVEKFSIHHRVIELTPSWRLTL